MNIINNRHDSFFRKILSNKEIAVEYFKNYLPAYISDRLDFSTLHQTTDSYVSKELKKSYADIVFDCYKKNEAASESKKRIKLSILVEHKSYIDKFAPFQIGSYIFSGYLKQIANKEELSIIIPVLFYHGNEAWEYKMLTDLFENVSLDWQGFIPNFKYIYHNLWDLSDRQIETLSNQFLTASLLTLKHYMEENWLEDNAIQIFTRLENIEGNLSEALIVYFFSNSKTENAKFIEIVESLPLTLKDKIMSTLDFFVEKGKKEGIALGIEKGLEKGIEKGIESEKLLFTQTLLAEKKFTIEEIARLVGVSVEFVENAGKK